MILRRKVVSLKNIYLNETHELYNLKNISSLKVSSLVTLSWKYPLILVEISSNSDFFDKEKSTSLISFSSRYTFYSTCYLKQALFRLKIMSFYNFFFVANRIGSETSQKLPNESPPQNLFQLARDLFISMDSAITYIHFRNTELTISFKINAASMIRNTLVIILTNLLKQDSTFSSNTF